MWAYFKLILWGAMWIVTWVLAYPWRQGRDNCLTWAVKKWKTRGGYLVIRWSRHNTIKWIVWPHFLWLDEKYHIYLEHIVPIEESAEHMVPRPWFDAKHMVGDPEDVIEN